ncbi:3-beta hydroxysteroid dehydrogenase/isomerase [Thozetella sp. PMI_491]|nr:3-beta hydroxysteroid dehydrogenase/isomerase [Thozetella sp. PMI_491]
MAPQKKSNLGNVLVIGGCGFLGHHVVRVVLRDYKVAVSVIDLRCTRNRRPDSDGVKYFEADITDTAKLQSLFEEIKPDIVIHTASPIPQSDSGSMSNAIYYKVNVEGTQSVIEAARATGVKGLVYTSSASIISDNVSDLINANEEWPVIRGKAQTEYYSETKAAAEELILAANRKDGSKLLTCAIRPSGIMGEGDTMQMLNLLRVYEEGKSWIQVGENDNLFDFTHVENVAHAHLLAAQALLVTYDASTAPLDHEKVDGEAFFITNGSPVYFWDYARTIWHYAGSPQGKDHVWVLPRGLGLTLGLLSEIFFAIIRKPPTFTRQRIVYATMTRYYDIGKAKRRLGYAPIVSLEEGIKRGVQWFLETDSISKK